MSAAKAGENTRREFLQTSSAVAAGVAGATLLSRPAGAFAGGDDLIKVGLIGCGGRGTGAAEQCVTAAPNVKLYAMADMFPDRLDGCKSNLGKLGDKISVADDRCFTGFDAYQKLIDSGVDLVILATPPGFRPTHIEAVIKAGKNLFTEKPVAVDGPGIRQVLAAAEEAKKKGLAVVAGTQRRHEKSYLEAMSRLHAGEIGEIVGGRCYWNQGGLWSHSLAEQKSHGWSDMEWQIRNWLYFTWLSGDHICEQHVHNLDVMNWALGAHPVRAVGMGGRQVRVQPDFGNIFDHFATDLEYPNGVHVMSMARQIDGCENNVSEAVIGTKGDWSSNGMKITSGGKTKWRFRGNQRNPYEQEHVDLIASIRAGRPLNELKTVAESTLTAIMSRMSSYTGKSVTWEQALNSKLSLTPAQLAFGPIAIPPVAVPGSSDVV